MARKARERSVSGIYHTFVKSISGLELVTDQEDHTVYAKILTDLNESESCTIYGYSLHPHYIHLLIKEGSEEIGQIMKRIATSYSYYFNVKYDHYGPIYDQRFKSQPVEDRAFFLKVLDFIGSRPVEYKQILTRIIPRLPEADATAPHPEIIDYTERPLRITESRLLAYLQQHHSFTNIGEFLQRPLEDQNRVIADCKHHGGSVRQLARLTGMPFQQVFRAK